MLYIILGLSFIVDVWILVKIYDLWDYVVELSDEIDYLENIVEENFNPIPTPVSYSTDDYPEFTEHC